MIAIFMGLLLTYFFIVYVLLPLAVILSIIAFVRYMRLKSYKAIRNIAFILYIPPLIVGILYMVQ